MEYIKKYNSGFYGRYDHTGILKDASLLPWDGKRGTCYQYDTAASGFEYYIDAQNNVYYTDANGKDARYWCSGKRLNAHCNHLQQIKAR